MAKAITVESRIYTLYRHSGRKTDDKRLVSATTNRERAWEKYYALVRKMRQGAVLLYCDGELLQFAQAPTLRTRW